MAETAGDHVTRLLTEAEWAALTHAVIITWGAFTAIFIVCYGLRAVPEWITNWRHARRITRRIIQQTEDELAALDVTQPITTRLIPADCGCAVRQHPREVLTCPTHAHEKGIDLGALWREGAR